MAGDSTPTLAILKGSIGTVLVLSIFMATPTFHQGDHGGNPVIHTRISRYFIRLKTPCEDMLA